MATRLYPLSKHMPKSLLPICDRELLHYQVTQLAMAGINEIVLAAGHLVDQLREFTAGYSGGLRFHYSLEPEPRGTAGAIAEARDFLTGEPVVVLNADILSSVRIADLIAEHERRGRVATLVGFAVNDPSRYGLLHVDGDALTGFSEKPEGQISANQNYINAGIYVLEPQVYVDIPVGENVSIERQTFPKLISEHGSLTHFAHEGLWLDVGTFESYFQANFALLARRYVGDDDWLWGQRDDCAIFKDQVFLSKSAQLGERVDLFHRVIVMRGASIGGNSRLENCLVLPDANIGEGCALNDCIICPGVTTENGSTLANVVLIKDEEPVPFFPHAT